MGAGDRGVSRRSIPVIAMVDPDAVLLVKLGERLHSLAYPAESESF